MSTDTYGTTISGLLDDTTYQYRSYVIAGEYGYTGNTLQTYIPAIIDVPSVKTSIGLAVGYYDGTTYKGSIDSTGR